MKRYHIVEEEVKVPNSLNGFRNWQFSSGSTTGEDFNKFALLYKAHIKKLLPDCELVNFTKGHYFILCFIKSGDKFVYLSTSDVRYSPHEWYNNILIRTAKHDRDYNGGANCFTTLEQLPDKVKLLLKES